MTGRSDNFTGRQIRKGRLFLLLTMLAVLTPFASSLPHEPAVHIRCWYWLNSTTKDRWSADFKEMKKLGLTDVVLVWGLDASAFSVRLADSHEAISDAYRAGLGSYLFVWHARHNALPHDPRYEQVDAAGHVLYAFDTFNPSWRKGQWKTYLQTLAREYGRQKGMAGYVFDNCFAIGNIGTIDGDAPKPEAGYLAYGDYEQSTFGQPLPKSTRDSEWKTWTAMREHWWAEWAADTQKALRSLDPDLGHQIVLEDGSNAIDSDAMARAGFALKSVIKHFDSMSAYLAPDYTSNSSQSSLGSVTTTYLKQMRSVIGPGKDLTLSLRLSDGNTEDVPGHSATPTLEQIQDCINAALAMGVHNLDLYGYRMGIYHLDGPGWLQFRPGKERNYPLTGEIKGKFLADRPELWPGLTKYFKSIKAGNRYSE